MDDLVRSRRVRVRLAQNDPPDGWPIVDENAAALLNVPVGTPMPKCSMMGCPEPGVYQIATHSLLDTSSMTSCACGLHLAHLAASGAAWVR